MQAMPTSTRGFLDTARKNMWFIDQAMSALNRLKQTYQSRVDKVNTPLDAEIAIVE